MLSDRERSQFALIEQGLMSGDPLFVARCSALGRKVRRLRPATATRTARSAGRRSVHAAGLVPTILLGGGLLLLVLGGAAAAVPIVVAGILMAMAALGLALTAPQRARPDTP
ncbi:DUF3040 domain-containing protein [Pseudonocardia sp. RS11V-5]|uniref:DUF3040 domain-containing protein n=1 Tax=Pseudonocardia terrae TaxID=2905831 RepID=UPI001E417FED|nr:DUF3040 domain-containing protein [Pseudonocardia terrae]MCE3553518.1 DUF3040 domain-containing protein [Pseudonocardia terrae]